MMFFKCRRKLIHHLIAESQVEVDFLLQLRTLHIVKTSSRMPLDEELLAAGKAVYGRSLPQNE